jgi:hypothetical protein
MHRPTLCEDIVVRQPVLGPLLPVDHQALDVVVCIAISIPASAGNDQLLSPTKVKS